MKKRFVHFIQFVFVAIIFAFVGGAFSSNAKKLFEIWFKL
ncbi:hypothetical protein LBSP_19100 [Lentilactobacillus buchneri subsp. silagei]|nr:hypothetical protein LBSP_19100 [Lentilactobacillus buchneri subsp. silagei]